MLKITAEEVNFIVYQFLHESGFSHSSFVFAQEANMHENKFNTYRVPSGLLILFLEKALTLIHMETHLNENEDLRICKVPFTLLTPHSCDVQVEQTETQQIEQEIDQILNLEVDQQNHLIGANQDNQGAETAQFNQITDGQHIQSKLAEHFGASSGNAMQSNHLNAAAGFGQAKAIGGDEHSNLGQMNQSEAAASDQVAPADILNNGIEQDCTQYALANKIPLVSNGQSIRVISEHHGEIFFAKWNPHQRLLATGGTGDMFVDIWDYNLLSSQGMALTGGGPGTGLNGMLQGTGGTDPKPLIQLRHISLPQVDDHMPARADENHFIQSLQWSNHGEYLLTSAYDNIARVWNIQGKIQGLFRAQSHLVCSCWNRSDSLVASGGDETNVLVWNPSDIQKEPLYMFQQGGTIIDIAWQNDSQLAAASQSEIYLWSIESPQQPLQIWQGHVNLVENIKWDQRGHLLASCAQEDSQVLIWSPKSKQPVICINDSGDAAIRDFKWSNVDPSQSGSTSANSGVGFIITLGMDQNVKLYDITSNRAEHLITLFHDNHVGRLALSPDNSLLAVGGQNSEIYVWSLKDQKLLRCFYNPSLHPQGQEQPLEQNGGQQNPGEDDLMMGGEGQAAQQTLEDDPNCNAVQDVNWSHDGSVIGAAIEKNVIMLDMRAIIATPIEALSARANANTASHGGGQAAGEAQRFQQE